MKERGNLNGTKTDTTNTAREQAWLLEHVGNWEHLSTENNGNPVSPSEDRNHDTSNEIEEIEPDAYPSSTPSYDDAGNLYIFPDPGDEDEASRYTYDYLSRLIKVENSTDYNAKTRDSGAVGKVANGTLKRPWRAVSRLFSAGPTSI